MHICKQAILIYLCLSPLRTNQCANSDPGNSLLRCFPSEVDFYANLQCAVYRNLATSAIYWGRKKEREKKEKILLGSIDLTDFVKRNPWSNSDNYSRHGEKTILSMNTLQKKSGTSIIIIDIANAIEYKFNSIRTAVSMTNCQKYNKINLFIRALPREIQIFNKIATSRKSRKKLWRPILILQEKFLLA